MKFILIQIIVAIAVIVGAIFFFTKVSFIVQQIIIIFIVLILFILLSMLWPPDSPWSPWWKTKKNTARAAIKLAKITRSDIVYELGSGDSEAVICFAKESGARCVGVEIDPLRHFQSRLRVWKNKLSRKIILKKNNFFDISLSDATVVYVYLVPKALNRLKEKFYKELKPGTRIVSYRYGIEFLHEVAKDVKNEMYLYEIPSKSKLKNILRSLGSQDLRASKK